MARRHAARRRPPRRPPPRASSRRWLRRVRRVLALLLLMTLGGPPLQVAWLRWLPPPLTGTRLQRAVGELAEGGLPHSRRDRVPLSSIDPDLVQAVLVAEDQRFWIHGGFDLDQVEAAVRDRMDGGDLRGASTLSMQTARTLFLWQGRSWVRKAFEAVYTLWLELLLPKERILELYLNEVEWGPSVFGAQAAARHHFGVAADDLSPDQACALATILPDPRHRDPNDPGEVARRKQAWIAGQMNFTLPTPDR